MLVKIMIKNYIKYFLLKFVCAKYPLNIINSALKNVLFELYFMEVAC